jgi:hypothetical protein
MTDIVLGKTHSTLVSFTRPANTDTYAAGDVVCNAATLVFPHGAKFGSTVLNHAIITTSANVATKPDLELWLFSATVAAVADNAAFAPTDAEMLTLLGVIEFPTADFRAGLSGSGSAGNAVCEASGLGLPITSLTDSAIYGQLVVRNAYAPISAEAFQIRLSFLD